MNPSLDDFAGLLAQAERFHGHVCPGIAIGTRMAMAGLRWLGIRDPRGADRRRLIVFVEMDRCATDAILSATGCSPGRRSMKVLDYGKMAATFVDLESGRAVRLAARPPREDGREAGRDFAVVPDEELFTWAEVEVALRPEDLPGKPVRTCLCADCGERVMDGREVVSGGRSLCRPCAEGGRYYRPLGGAR
ncbi:MAG TPA: FmdE family protein [Anaeromyxobacter sp.]|nr:FmdE family protein [Anaeromyxobacter sp.]